MLSMRVRVDKAWKLGRPRIANWTIARINARMPCAQNDIAVRRVSPCGHTYTFKNDYAPQFADRPSRIEFLKKVTYVLGCEADT